MTLKKPVGFQREYIIRLIINSLGGRFIRKNSTHFAEHNDIVPRENK